MGVIDRSVRLPLALFAVCGSLALGLLAWIEISSNPPTILTISSGVTRSAPFRVYDDALYLVTVRVDDQGDWDQIRCALGVKPDVATCLPATAPFTWTIYKAGKPYIAPGPENAFHGGVRSHPGIAEHDLGSIRLKPGGGYVLEIRASGDIPTPWLRHPKVVIQEHHWESKFGGGIQLLLIFMVAALAAAITFLWLLIAFLSDVLSRPRRRR